MATRNKLQFEEIEATGLRISKPFQTRNKDTIRVAITPGKNAVIMGNKKAGFPEITVDVPKVIPPVMMKQGFWARVWDAIKKAVKAVFGGGIDIGPSCKLKPQPILAPGSLKPIGFILTLECKL